MKRVRSIGLLVVGLVLIWSMAMGDFYVIPARRDVDRENYAPVPKTGQTECHKEVDPWEPCECGTSDCPAGQDGDLQKGVGWPNPRFTDNLNGTVTDNLTGLVWTKDADCDGEGDEKGLRTWLEALDYCSALKEGICGLGDGSSAGAWRLANRGELQSLLSIRFGDPAMPNTAGTGPAEEGDPFTHVRSAWYWTSSTYAISPGLAWVVSFQNGSVNPATKTTSGLVRCVR